jgi:ankyrin repeat protein
MSKNTKDPLVNQSSTDPLGDWVVLPQENSDFESSEEEEVDLNSLSEELLNAMLLESAGTNQIDEAKKLLALKNVDPKDSNKVDPQNPNKVNRNFIDENGNTALSHAVKAKNVEMMELLLGHQADPNLKIKDGNTVLHYVTTLEVAKLLLAYKADPNIKNNKGQLPSDCAQNIPIFDQSPPPRLVKTYKDEPLSLLLTPPQKLLDRKLLAAVREKNHTEAQELLQQRANPNIQDQMGRGLLTKAIMNNDEKMVELLINNKANVNIWLNKSDTDKSNTVPQFDPLSCAIQNRANLNKIGSAPCPQEEIAKNDNIITLLIRNKANIAYLRPGDITPSEIAITHKLYDIAFWLQYTLYKQNKLATKKFHNWVTTKNINKIKLCVEELGFDVNTKGASGNTALTIAQRINDTEILNILNTPSIIQQKNQAVINRLLQVAAIQNNIAMLTDLLDMGADINNQDKEGNTALHYAAIYNKIHAVTLLIENKAEVTLKNNKGETALGIGQVVAQNIKLSIQQKSNKGETNHEDLIAHQKNNAEIIALIQSAQEKQIELVSEQKNHVEKVIDPLAGGLFEEGDMSDESEVIEEEKESEVIEESEEEEERATQEKAIFPAKKALNKHIEAIKKVAKTEDKLASKLEQLQKAINIKREIDYDKENVDSSTLTQNSNKINNLITELAQATQEPAILNNLLIIATTQADNSTTELLAKNAVVNKDFIDQDGYSALHYAAIQGDIEKVNSLIAKGANINSQDKHGNTPLHTAVILKKTEAIKLLLDNGAEVDTQDTHGNTAAHFAADAGDQATIELLQKKNADFTIEDHDGFTTLDHAIKSAKDIRDNIDYHPQVTQDESSSKDSSNNSSSTSSTQQYFYQKLLNLIGTVKSLVSKEEVTQQDNAKFLLETQFLTLLKSLDFDDIHNKNSADPDILKSLDNIFEHWHEPTPTSVDLLAINNLMQPVCE